MFRVKDYDRNLSIDDRLLMREHISISYLLAESLSWCDPERDLTFKTQTERTSNTEEEMLVPIISTQFNSHSSAQKAYTELQEEANSSDIDMYDVHYEQKKMQIAIVLDPLRIE